MMRPKLAPLLRAALLAAACALAVSGCRGGFSVVGEAEDGGLLPPSPPLALRLEGFDPAAPLEAGAVVQLHVIASWAQPPELDVTLRAEVVSSRPEVAAVDPATRALRAVAPGKAQLTATFSAAGATLHASLDVEVRAAGAGETVKVEVAPALLSLAKGAGEQLRAFATRGDGSRRDATAEAAWSAVGAACSVDDAARKGFVQALAAGSCTVQAKVGQAAGAASVTVLELTVTALALTPGSLKVPVAQTARLAATATLSDGSALDATASAAWTSDDPSVATVQAGRVTGVRANASTTVRAELGGKSASAAVTVDAAALVSIDVFPPQVTLPAGLTQQLRANALYADGTTFDVTTQATWKSDAPAVADVAAAGTGAGMVKAVAKGRTTVRAAIGSVSGGAAVIVTDATLVRLAIQPAALTLPAGTGQRLRAIGTFSDLSQRDVSAEAGWGSSDATVVAVDATGFAAGLQPGKAQVKASFGGQAATASVEVSDATLSALLVLPVSAVLPVGLSTRLFATGVYSDNSLRDLTEQATWASSAPSVVGVSNAAGQRGTVTGLAAGQADVAALLGPVASGPVPVTVTAATLLSLRLQPPRLLVPVYQTLPFRLLARYSDGSEFDETSRATFVSDQPAVAAVVTSGPGAGFVTGLSRGTASVKASLPGMSVSGRVDVLDAQVASVTIQAQRDNMPVGDSQQLRCLVRYQGAPAAIDETPLCAWTSSDASVGRFNQNPAGLVVAVSPGSFTAAAQVQGVTGTRTLAVTAVQPDKIEVLEGAITLPRGVTRALIAIGTYPGGKLSDLTYGAEWASDKNAVAVVGNGGVLKGLVTGVAPGVAHVSARVGTLSGQGTVTVTDAKAKALSIAPVNPVVRSPGGPFQPTRNFPFYATATFDDGTQQNVTEAVSWLSSDPDVCTINNSPGRKGVADILSPGGATITAVLGSLSASTFLTSR